MKLARDVAKCIQSTLISNTVTATRLDAHIEECLKYSFHAAMVPPGWVSKAASSTAGTGVRGIFYRFSLRNYDHHQQGGCRTDLVGASAGGQFMRELQGHAGLVEQTSSSY